MKDPLDLEAIRRSVMEGNHPPRDTEELILLLVEEVARLMGTPLGPYDRPPLISFNMKAGRYEYNDGSAAPDPFIPRDWSAIRRQRKDLGRQD